MFSSDYCVICELRGVNPDGNGGDAMQSSPPIIYRTLRNCFSYPAKIVKLSQRKIMTEKSESISMKTFFFLFFFFLKTTCFWAEITNVFPKFPRNSVANFREIICATFDGSVSSPPIIFTDVRHCVSSTHYFFGSDYFTENFQLKENKTRMRNNHPRFFHLVF